MYEQVYISPWTEVLQLYFIFRQLLSSARIFIVEFNAELLPKNLVYLFFSFFQPVTRIDIQFFICALALRLKPLLKMEKTEKKIVILREVLIIKVASQGRRNGGGARWTAGPSKFPRLNKVGHSQIARYQQSLIVMAPQIFVPSDGSASYIMSSFEQDLKSEK